MKKLSSNDEKWLGCRLFKQVLKLLQPFFVDILAAIGDKYFKNENSNSRVSKFQKYTLHFETEIENKPPDRSCWIGKSSRSLSNQ